jgi:hypothetical protein
LTGANVGDLLYASIADNDFFRLRVGGTSSNAGYVEIATSDDGTEPIYVRQYTGVFSSLTRTATLLDGSGNTSFPGTVTAPTFSGALSGNATTATTAGALTSMNISQFTNNNGYLTSITSGNVTTALGYTPYNATNPNGYITGVTNISGTAGSETLATVTGRGASTSTAISINNTLTVTSGRVIARTGGANTYGIFSGYDNNNHMMTFRSAVTGPTASPTFTAGHQTTFIEYAEANDTTGWFFKSSSSTNYEDVAKITRIGITPGSNGTQNLGSSSLRWNTLFTSDLSLSNGIGDYTIVEGEEKLYLYNNKNNKVYSFVLQEEDPATATPKRPE